MASLVVNHPNVRGLLIVLEGTDRAGKSSAHARLLDTLNAQNPNSVVGMRFPDYTTEIGKIILRYLKREIELDDHAVHLLFSANRQEMKARMHTLLAAGRSIVVDRYCYSGVAYSIAKGLNSAWCTKADQASGLPGPDLVLFLEVSPEEAAKRADYGADRYEKIDFQRKTMQVYQRFELGDDWVRVDANRSKEEVFADVLSHTQAALDKHAVASESAPVPVRTWLGLCFAETEEDAAALSKA